MDCPAERSAGGEGGQGVITAIRVVVEAGALYVATLQLDGGRPFRIERDAAGDVTNRAELEAYLEGVRAEGASCSSLLETLVESRLSLPWSLDA